MKTEIKYINGDSLEILSKPGDSYNAIITSPPYNTRRKSHKAYDEYEDYRKTDSEYISWVLEYFNQFSHALAPNGVILWNQSYGNENTTLLWKVINAINDKTEFIVNDVIYWKKKNAMPNVCSANKLTRVVEPIFVISRKTETKTYLSNKKITSQRPTGQKMYTSIPNWVEAKNNDGATELNKATFSTELIEKLIDIFVPAGAWVLDPFSGTGTTGIACVRKGVNCVGIELSEAQTKYSVERLSKECYE